MLFSGKFVIYTSDSWDIWFMGVEKSNGTAWKSSLADDNKSSSLLEFTANGEMSLIDWWDSFNDDLTFAFCKIS